MFSALHNSMSKLCSAFLNVNINWKLVEKVMHSFGVHSNESACRKSGRLGLEQVIRKKRRISSRICVALGHG